MFLSLFVVVNFSLLKKAYEAFFLKQLVVSMAENGLSYQESHENHGFHNAADDPAFQPEDIVYEELEVPNTTDNPLYVDTMEGNNTSCNTSAEDIVTMLTDNPTYESAEEKIVMADNPIYQSCQDNTNASDIRETYSDKSAGIRMHEGYAQEGRSAGNLSLRKRSM